MSLRDVSIVQDNRCYGIINQKSIRIPFQSNIFLRINGIHQMGLTLKYGLLKKCPLPTLKLYLKKVLIKFGVKR